MAAWPPAMQLLGIGWYVAICIVGGVLGGLWLDDIAGTGPLLTLIGLGLGLASSGWGGYRMLQQLFDAQERRRLAARAADQPQDPRGPQR